jgi:hypothetical protein
MGVFADLVDWVMALPPELAFLFALPFVVAALGLADCLHHDKCNSRTTKNRWRR